MNLPPTPPGYVIRPLTPSDAPAYVVLRAEMLADTPWAFGSSPGSDHASDPEAVAAALARPGFAILGAFESQSSGETAGPALVAAAGVRREDAIKQRHLAGVWGVYATPRARGVGLGRAVTAAAVETARGWRDPDGSVAIAAIGLCVNEGSPRARAVYESLGFVAWGTEPDALRVEGRSYSEVHMRLRVG